jgi:hypothetical protein|tara:strand:- start:303 stop:425 length:123 start_codon:yes stop_codon:yes gene_type:complete
MDKEEFHRHVNTGVKLVFGISLAVAAAVVIMVLLVFLIVR